MGDPPAGEQRSLPPVHRCARPSPPWPWSALPLAPSRGYIESFATWLILRPERYARRRVARKPTQPLALDDAVRTPRVVARVEDAELPPPHARQEVAQAVVVADVRVLVVRRRVPGLRRQKARLLDPLLAVGDQRPAPNSS